MTPRDASSACRRARKLAAAPACRYRCAIRLLFFLGGSQERRQLYKSTECRGRSLRIAGDPTHGSHAEKISVSNPFSLVSVLPACVSGLAASMRITPLVPAASSRNAKQPRIFRLKTRDQSFSAIARQFQADARATCRGDGNDPDI